MKSFNSVLGKVSLVFVFFMLVGQVNIFGNVVSAQSDNFSITPADNIVNSLVWNLKYSESENGFKITLQENNGEKVFTVRSKFFEIAYVLNKKGFGARMVSRSRSQVPEQILWQIINQEALNNQKVISDASTSNEIALNLIASYLPDLINDSYKQLLR